MLIAAVVGIMIADALAVGLPTAAFAGNAHGGHGGNAGNGVNKGNDNPGSNEGPAANNPNCQ